MDSPKEVLL